MTENYSTTYETLRQYAMLVTFFLVKFVILYMVFFFLIKIEAFCLFFWSLLQPKSQWLQIRVQIPQVKVSNIGLIQSFVIVSGTQFLFFFFLATIFPFLSLGRRSKFCHRICILASWRKVWRQKAFSSIGVQLGRWTHYFLLHSIEENWDFRRGWEMQLQLGLIWSTYPVKAQGYYLLKKEFTY